VRVESELKFVTLVVLSSWNCVGMFMKFTSISVCMLELKVAGLQLSVVN